MPRQREGPTLNKQTGYYFMDIYVGFGSDKKRIRYSLRTKDPAKAQYLYEHEYRKIWAEYYGDEIRGRPKPMLLSELIEKFVNHSRYVRKIGTWKSYERRLHIIKKCWGDIDINKVDSGYIVMLDNFLHTEGRGNKTINDYFGTLRTLFYYAIRQKLFKKENPILEFKPYVVAEKRREYSDSELLLIIKAAKNIEKKAFRNSTIQRHAYAIIKILQLTGMRLGEVLNLKWENIRGNKLVLQRTETKEKKIKTIPITPAIQEALNGLIDNRETKKGFLMPRNPGRAKQKIEPRTARSFLLKIRKESGIPDFTFHGLRHTAANKMINEGLGKGAGIRDIQDVLGHSQLATTMRYLHSNADRMVIALKTLEVVKKDEEKTQDKP